MGTIEQMPGLRREYGMNSWTKGIFTLLGLAMAGGGIFGAWKVMPLPGSGILTTIFALVPTSLGIFLLAYAFRSRLVIEGSHITVRGPFTEKSADLDEIEGFRTFSSRNGTYRQIYLKEGRGSITLSSSFSTDDDFKAWFQKIPDLDERDRQALLDEIAQQQDLGATPEERLAALTRAKAISIALLAASVLLSVAIDFNFVRLSLSMVRLCVVLLALAPLVSAWLVWRSPLLYVVMKRKNDPRGEVSWVVFIAGLAYIFRTSGDHFVSMGPMIVSMVVVGIALVAIFFNAAKAGARGAWVALLMFAGIYGYGSVAVTDIVFDDSPAAAYTTTVVGGHVSHGKSTTYYLRLAPWGPIVQEDDVSVSHTVYRNAHIGDTVCTTLHGGRLNAPWFQVTACGDESAPQNTVPSDLPQ